MHDLHSYFLFENNLDQSFARWNKAFSELIHFANIHETVNFYSVDTPNAIFYKQTCVKAHKNQK